MLLAGHAGLGKARHLPGGGGKMAIAPAAAAAARRHKRLIAGHIRHQAAGLIIVQQGAARHPYNAILSGAAGTALGAAIAAGGCHIFALVAEIRQRVHPVIRHKHHTAATAAIAAVRATGRHIFFPMEGDCTIAAVAGLDLDDRFIHKHEQAPPLFTQFSTGRAPARPSGAQTHRYQPFRPGPLLCSPAAGSPRTARRSPASRKATAKNTKRKSAPAAGIGDGGVVCLTALRRR